MDVSTLNRPVDSVGACPADGFLTLLPIVQRHAETVFRRLSPVDHEEAVAESLAVAFISYQRLREQGKDGRDFPLSIAICATRHVCDGRHVGGSRNTSDVLSWRARTKRGFRVESLSAPSEQPCWRRRKAL